MRAIPAGAHRHPLGPCPRAHAGGGERVTIVSRDDHVRDELLQVDPGLGAEHAPHSVVELVDAEAPARHGLTQDVGGPLAFGVGRAQRGQ